MATETMETHVRIPRRRWRIAWLLWIGVMVSYFDRVNLSASHGALIATFGISDFAFGVLSGAYNITYCLFQLPIGVILDRFGVRKVGRVGTFLWSIATFGAAAAPSLPALFGARFLLGVGEAPTFPANAKAVSHWFPPRERSFATAMFDSAAKFSSVIGIPLVGLVLLKAGWRWSFAMTGVLSLLYFVYFWFVYREPDDDPGLSGAERHYIESAGDPSQMPSSEPASSLFHLLGQRKVLGLALGFGSYNYVFYLLLTWLPSYFAFALHIDMLHSFLYTSVPWLIATFCELVIGGWLVDFLVKRGADASRVRRSVLITGATCGLGILGAAHAHSATQALIWISISIGGLSAHSAVGWSLPSFIAGRKDIGKVGGIVNFSNQVSGICAPIITGYLVSTLHSYAWVFGVSAIYLSIGIAGYLFLLGKVERPQQKNSAAIA
ncbi:MAG TPA: MFS transporter [Terracidiphilus sp.]|jgi:sugar phosphate permease|nr:MFS transporter [Terracidiphilus sp.]